jgi:hypothetical protein
MRIVNTPSNLVTVAAVLAMICPIFGQSTGTTPPAGDPNVVAMFFAYYDTLAADVQTKRQQNAATADPAEQGAAKSIGGLTVTDFRTVGTVNNALKQQLQAIDGEGAAYAQSLGAAQQAPDAARLRDLAARRQGAITGGIQSLQKTLSPAGWVALSTYIDGEFRKGITRRLLK